MARTPTCHPARRHYARGLCELCYRRARAREWYASLSPAEREARLAQMRERARARRLEAAARKGGPRRGPPQT